MAITTKDQLKAYILRQLGQGINRIEVTDAQLNDAIENAISYFEQEVDGGLEEKILVIPISAGLQEYYLAPEVMGIMEVISSRGMSSSSDILSSMTQYKMDSASALTIGSGTGGLKYYVSNMQYMAMLDQFLGEGVTFSFNSTTKKLTIHETVTSDSVMVMTTLWSIRDEPEMWNNQFIKEYSTALAMHQWGRNMSKFNGAAIVGNFELNGSGMIQMADAEISRLREELTDKYTSPLGIWIA
jgi:hypothetical protein